MLVHAHRILKDRAPRATAATWAEQIERLVPQEVYRDTEAGANWNVVNVSGEALRRHDQLVAATQMAAQQQYLDEMLSRQQGRFTKFGMYDDPNAPLAYDAFPRLWLEDMIADGAYVGPHRQAIEDFLLLGGFSSLLLLAPSGEWPSAGRSAHHQWNEAAIAAICEMNAVKWKARHRDDIAGPFKRGAHLALKSMLRWQRPSGEMWIVKNFAEPDKRFGFEGYSFHSQYNLLPMAMLSIACERADESIAERPVPSEYGSYAFDTREKFTTIAAAAGGYYVLINTSADPHYNATGLQRVHRRGVELSPLTDSAAEERAIVALPDDPRDALSPAIQWKDDQQWIGVSHFYRADPNQPLQRIVKQADLEVTEQAEKTSFGLTYHLEGPGARTVKETYTISSAGVACAQHVDGDPPMRFAFPALVDDGAHETKITLEPGQLRIVRAGGALTLRLISPARLNFKLTGPRLATHNGHVQAAVAELPRSATSVEWMLELTPQSLTHP